MNESNSSGNLSKGDVISFVALLLMGVLVFFGMNFQTLGDRIFSLIGAILIVILMTLFIFLAAYAKAQNRYQSTWKKVEHSMVALYILCLIPCYIYSAKFFDIQFDKKNVIQQVNAETESLDNMFKDYNRTCDSRINAYQTKLSALITHDSGRAKIAGFLKKSDPSTVQQSDITQMVSSFSKMLKGGEYSTLEAEKKSMLNECESSFKSWDILFIPQNALKLGSAKEEYARNLEEIYNKAHNDLEESIPYFSSENYKGKSDILDTFESTNKFSIPGLLAVLFLGFLGFLKYLFGKRRTVIPLKRGDKSEIEKGGGILY